MDTFEQIAQRIIQEQLLIIGPLAYSEAERVSGLSLGKDKQSVVLSGGDKQSLIDQLVARYERLFGQASIQVCRDAAAPLLPELRAEEIPLSLK